jgi:hypothetical protein
MHFGTKNYLKSNRYYTAKHTCNILGAKNKIRVLSKIDLIIKKILALFFNF